MNLDCADDTCKLPIASIKKDICYSLKATNYYGCSGVDTICIKVFCEGSQVFIPNTFTPDGDNLNDKLILRATGIKLVKHFIIFNRWGEIVFEKNNFPPNEPNFGWDGKVNGRMSSSGVYVYIAEVVCENNIIYTYKGNITLLN